ncbi:MAG: fasciclin domain-containing protein [Parasphingorhabdus sp.]
MSITKTLASATSAMVLSVAVFSIAVIPANPVMAGDHAQKAKTDIVDTAVAAGTFNTLVAAVQAAGLEATLRSDGPFTVFAPSDDAFAKLPAGTVETLLKPENKEQLVSILTYHVVPGKVYSKSLAGKQIDAKTVQGTTVAVNGTDGVKVDNATVVAADIKTSNGVIHVIDSVLMP